MTSLIIILVSLLFSGFFSGMEIAFVSANKVRASIDMAKSGLVNRIINVFFSHRDMLISTLLIGNNIVNVVYSMAMADLISKPIAKWMGGNEFIELLLVTVISTIIIVIAGEFLPKTIFRINPNRSLRMMSLPLYTCYIILYPISKFSQMLSAGLMRLLGIKVEKEQVGFFTVEELDAYLQDNIDKHEDQHKEVEREVKIFENALDFGDTQLRDCMVPRNEIVAVDINDTTREQLVEIFGSSGLSKIVVYNDDIDNVTGFIQVSELFTPEVDWKTRIKPVLFAPETMLAKKMMQELMDKKRSIAIVLDEFGGTSGMLTLEDLVEEIFGEIEDEHDHNRLAARQIDKNTYEFSGRMEIEEINERFHLGLPESDDYQTIAGYVLFRHEALPAVGETLTLDGFKVTVVRKTAAPLTLLRVVVPESEE
ncbi:MAG: HlyC/CorC family transporter [Bacteroidales bacterium]|nr:HlyC/CorC family transporter [Candidatus Sodaliphilus aphodohippi]